MPLHRARLRISEYNKNRKRRLRGQERKIQMVSLSLTSMVDMFAILVIFLLVNSSSVSQWIEVGRDVVLPKAKHADEPKKAATLEITLTDVYGDKALLAKVADLKASSGKNSLKAWLSTIKSEHASINLVAHEEIPFGVLKSIIAACQSSGVKQVNLAVQPTQ